MKRSVCPYICCCVWRCICGGCCRSMSCCLCLSLSFCLFSAVAFVFFLSLLLSSLLLCFCWFFLYSLLVFFFVVVVPLLQSIFPQQSFLHKVFCNKAPCAVRISNVPRHGLHCFNTHHLSIKRKFDRMHLTQPL